MWTSTCRSLLRKVAAVENQPAMTRQTGEELGDIGKRDDALLSKKEVISPPKYDASQEHFTSTHSLPLSISNSLTCTCLL